MTLFVVLAHSEKARMALYKRNVRLLAHSFPRDDKSWWVDPQGRVALFNATTVTCDHGPVIFSVDSHRFLYSEDLSCGTPSALPGSVAGGAGAHPEGVDSVISRVCSKGVSVLARVTGDFAIACWDSRRAQLLLARDHLGQKQIYFRHSSDVTVFCSELGPLLKDHSWARQMDFESAINYLDRGMPLVGRTLAKGIESVPAAHALVCDSQSRPRIQRYWSPLNSHSDLLTRKRLVANVTEAMNEAVFRCLDRNTVALLLSGGVDSSYVAYAAARRLPPKSLRAYTIQYEPGYHRNEGHYAASVTRSIGAEHELVSLSPSQAYSFLQKVLASPVPCSAWATITHHRLLLEVSARKEPCLLSGLGADEIFGGYDRYLDYYFRQRRYARKWARAADIDWFDALLSSQNEATSRLFPGIASFFDRRRLSKSLYQPFARIVLDDFDRAFYRECHGFKRNAHIFEMMVAHECQHRIPDLLMSNFEPVARALGVRTAYPFLDPLLINWASFIGPSDRYWYENGHWWAKKLFREIASNLVPQFIVMRRRATYDAPIADWLCEPAFGPSALAQFSASRFWQVGFLRPSLRDDLIERAKNLPASLYRTSRRWLEEFWAVLTLCAWFDRYVEGRSA